MSEESEQAASEPSVVDGVDLADLVERARSEDVSLTGPGGLLSHITKTVLESALTAELDDHLGYEKGDPAGRGAANQRNGRSQKTVHTDVGSVRIDIPRDRNGSFDPQIVPKHARRIEGFDESVISLYAKGLTTGEIQKHLSEIYDVDVSRELISKITDKVVAEMNEWQVRPLDRVYPVVLIDAIFVKIRDRQVANRPIYVAVGVTLAGQREVLGLWAGTGGEGAKHWAGVLTELRNRGVEDVMIVCCDGPKGLPEAINATWPLADIQQCVVHLIRSSLKYSSRKYWSQITTEPKTIYTAPTVEAAQAAFDEFATTWEDRYPAMVATWRNSWEQFIPFLKFPAPIRKLVYTTNAIESLNSRFRHAARRRGHFPNEQAALKVLYLVIRNPIKNRPNITGKVAGWKDILNTLAMFYGDRITEN
ncbi:IS256 family transposase [Saccharopolyspora mangrovi]|uniref:Mutator family transposase n=1 Tax=Saccharopolyspora mangrovi TaxID=3082379 RepID=A0ABU6AIH5_9PSEU|nr:IS256 family transposase [Saccharopolyspora sp. S2-29]MEB3371352.1 IS256 family transposase [Saccharopolyspora sp. S2-29]